ncbi:helix-turn-helix domain-containing protein [Streptomyces sp. NPDC092952]|uniref:helix-turn-helix domain-containing protein n=1 Tax=Streptomyces sp. NPDC092952 TaxID=3366018 RepID=UPI00381336D1
MVLLRTDLLMKSAAEAGHALVSQIAETAGVSESTMRRLVKGETTPSTTTLIALRRMYGVSLDDLVCESEPETA